MTKDEDCNYWVHQCCIGLHYKTEQKLKVVPLLCEEHDSKKQTKINVILKYSEIYTSHNIEKHTYVYLFL